MESEPIKPSDEISIAVTNLHEQIIVLGNIIDKPTLRADEIITLMLLRECADILKKSAHCFPK